MKLPEGNRTFIFWASFVALVTTAFAFMLRVQLLEVWEADFNLDKTQVGIIFGAGFWPFGVSIVVFSLIIDKVGYRASFIFAFLCFVAFALMSIFAKGFEMLYWASILGGLGAGAVEAAINPLIATLYADKKTKWLNILHAGWPGGLVVTGIVVLGLGDAISWQWKIALILIPAIIFMVMILFTKLPTNERVAAGVSYRGMLAEVGWAGAFIVSLLIVMELTTNVIGIEWMQVIWTQLGIAAIIAIIYGMYCRAFGRPLFVFLLILMLLLATTELGTDAWVKDLLKPAIKAGIGIDSGWVLVYTAAIMMTLRFLAGPFVQTLKPLGILALSAALATVGILWLSVLGSDVEPTAIIIIVAATIYAIGQTFFWPTTLGVVAERFPRGGAMTINVIAGVGMLGVGILGNPWLGNIQDRTVVATLQANAPTMAAEYISEPKDSLFGQYQSLNKVANEPTEQHKESIATAQREGKSAALRYVAILPAIMFVSYIAMIIGFRMRGGYKAITLEAEAT